MGTLADEHFGDPGRFFGGVAAVDSGDLNHVGLPQVVQLALALLEEENELVAGSIVVTHADFFLVPNDGFPKLEARGFCEGFGDEHRLLIAEQVKVAVLFQHPKHFTEEFGEALVGEYLKPLVAGCLALLQPGGGAHGPMFFQGLVGRIGHDEIDTGGWQAT